MIKVHVLPQSHQDLQYQTEGSAAIDLRSAAAQTFIEPGAIAAIPTGLFIAIPKGFAALVLPKSGKVFNNGLGVANAPGLIDEDFRGEIHVLAQNLTYQNISIHKSERFAQLMFIPYVKAEFIEVESLEETARGEGGFGSTGVA